MKSIVSQIIEEEKRPSTEVEAFCREFKIAQLLRTCNANKFKGYPVALVFLKLFELVFLKKNLSEILGCERHATFSKDTAYRFLNAPNINWQKFLLLLAMRVIGPVAALNNESRKSVLVVDDSFYGRQRSKKVELLSTVRDHADRGRMKFGFRMLTLGYSDGTTFLPLAFRLLSSKKPSNRKCEAKKDFPKHSLGFKRRQDALTESPQMMLMLLEQAVQALVPAKHVLFDSWFSCPANFLKIAEMKLFTVAMLKKTTKQHYRFQGETLSVSKILDRIRPLRRGRSRYLASTEIEVFKDDQNIPARLVYVRNKNNRKDWLVLISTDISMSEEEIIQLYGKRWDIEVFFKVSKSYLRLGKEFQGRSYDMLDAHTTLVFARFIMLSYEKRKCEDVRTLGALFRHCCDGLQDMAFIQALTLVLDTLKSVLSKDPMLTKEHVLKIVDSFIAALPCVFKEKLALC